MCCTMALTFQVLAVGYVLYNGANDFAGLVKYPSLSPVGMIRFQYGSYSIVFSH